MYLCSSLGENPYLVCTSRSLVEMEKTPERLLMNIPEEPFTGSCKRSQKNILHVHFLFTLWKYSIICTSHTQTHTRKYFFLFLNNGKQTINSIHDWTTIPVQLPTHVCVHFCPVANRCCVLPYPWATHVGVHVYLLFKLRTSRYTRVFSNDWAMWHQTSQT